MANKAFSLTSSYDATITNWFNKKSNIQFPERKIFFGNKIDELRYGENPHQKVQYILRIKKFKFRF